MKNLVAIPLLAILLACTGKDSGPEKATYRVERTNITSYVLVVGKVEAKKKATIVAPEGARAQNLFVKLGQLVKKDSPLIKFDLASMGTSLMAKEAELKNSRINLATAKKAYERASYLYQRRATSPKEYESAKSAYQMASNSFNAARTTFEEEKKRAAISDVRSPQDGVITYLWLGNESFVAGTPLKGGDRIITVADTSDLVVDVKVPEKDMGKVRKGLPARIKFESMPGVELRGQVAEIAGAPMVDPTVGLAYYPVRIQVLQVDPRVRTEMNANVEIVSAARKGTLTVPLYSVFRDSGGDYVEVKSGSSFEKKYVKVGITNDSAAEVISGLNEGDLVRAP